ncbi:MAG: DUF11 domain-containing protein [Bacteroidales bacterium]|nr:DUF11 domain-containing protein [Bacteroidales bacterium]
MLHLLLCKADKGCVKFSGFRTGVSLLIFLLSLFILNIVSQSSFAQTTSQTFTSGGSFTVPDGVTSITVECWGGGGAGGGARGNPAAGGGGAGGSYAKKVIMVTPGTSYTVTVGTGGAGSNNNGAAGNPSWFGTAATVYAQGGAGGALASSNNSNGAGGTGSAAASIGDLVYQGGSGSTGNYNSGTAGGAGGGGAGTTGAGGNASGGNGGSGGASSGGNGANGVGNSTAGGAGSVYGGGGSGGKARSSTDRAGGAGANGAVIITWTPCDFPDIFDVTGGGSYCSGGSGQAVGLSGSESGITYQLYRDGVAVGSPVNGTGSALSFGNQTTAGTYTVTATNAAGPCTSDMNGSAIITILSVPSQPSAISGSSSPCSGTSQTYSVTNVSGTTYTWTVPATWAITAGQGTNSITVTAGTSNGNLSVTPSNTCGNGTARTLAVTTTTVPVEPSIISGSTNPCSGTSQVYSVTNVAGVTFTWTFPAGWTQTAGGNTNSVTVTVGATSGNVTVVPSNACGNGSSRSLAVTVTSIPAQPSAITGNTTVCEGSTQTYSVTNVSGTTYTWTVPAGWVINSGQGSNTINVTAGSTGGNIQVTPSNACGNGSSRSVAVSVSSLPAQPGPISPATTEACQNSVHNFMVMPPPPAGVTYTWAFPGATILSGQGTNIAQIRFGNQSGTLTVTPSNSCGNGTPSTLGIAVSLSSPAMPGAITGVQGPCIGSSKTYSVTNISGLLYTWAVPSGWIINSGQGSNTINVTVGSGTGNVSVTATNACGGSAPRNLAVSPQASVPAQPSAIQGSSPVCQNSTQTYSVTAVPYTTYTWAVPAGWSITSGQGSSAVTVTTGNSSGTITVTPANDCGTGTPQNRSITVDITTPAATGSITGSNNPCQNSSQTYSVPNVNGVTYTWGFPSDWAITSGQGSNSVTVTTGAVSGNITVVPSNGCGNGPATTLPAVVFLLPANPGTITGNILFCEGSTQTYSVTPVTGVTYNWTVPAGWVINSGQGTHTIQTTAGVNSGNIQVTPQNGCGNGPAATLAVTVNPLPAANAGPDKAICVGASVQIGSAAVPGNTYSWTSDPAGFTSATSNPVVSPDVTTVYTLLETNTATGCTNTGDVTVLANQVISLLVNPLTQTICSGENAHIELSSNISGTTFTYEAELFSGSGTTGFSNGSGNVINQTLTNTSDANAVVDYAITATADECVNDNLKATVTVYPAPSVLNQTPLAVCSDVACGVVLGASVNAVAVASYNVISINSNGLIASAGNPVTGSGFSANILSDDAWTNTTSSTVNVVYTVQGVSATGCAGNVFTVTLPVSPEPVMTNSSSVTICSGSSTNITLTSTITATYSWTVGTITGGITGASAGSGSSINQVLTNPGNTTPGTVQYIVTPSAAGCQGEAFSITVTVNPLPAITAVPSVQICSGSYTGITLTASTPASFSWVIGNITGGITGAIDGSGSTINQLLINPGNSTSGTVEYIVTATANGSGCMSAAYVITVTVDPIPVVNAGATPSQVCPGAQFSLTSSSSLDFQTVNIHSENFNGQTDWTTSANSSGGTPANSDWTIRSSPYTYSSTVFNSGDNQFYLTNSAAQAGNNNARTRTYLRSPAISITGYISLSLDFRHYYLHDNNGHGYVRVSTNGSSWTNVADFTSTKGSPDNFALQTLDLTSYTGNPTLYIEFYFYAEKGFYWAIDNVVLKGTHVSTIPVISWTSEPQGFTSSIANPSNLTQGGTTEYTVTYTNPISGCSNDQSVTVTTLPLPAASISADYCSVPGYISLTASGGGTYLWNTGETTPVILVNTAGQYSVIVTGINGCVATAYLDVSNELVIDGSFTNFNAASPSFFTEYLQNQPYWDDTPPYDWGTAKGLHPEGRYAVNTNAWYDYPGTQNGYHPNFHGRDHTNNSTGPRNFLMVNGSVDLVGNPPHRRTIWQQEVTLYPSTDYYFSAWGMNLNPASPARLQFEIVTPQYGAQQVGSIANLNVAPKPTSEGEVSITNWVRFYSTPFWTSPPDATTALIRIVNLNLDYGGNDFGLDDISFGTLDPIPFVMEASAQSGNNVACEGESLQLSVDISGGLPPYTISWTGPDGFVSNEQNPVINNVTTAAQGTYTVVVSDSYGCTPQSTEVTVTILESPTASISGGGNYCQFSGSPMIWLNAEGGIPPYTFEYNINGGATETATTYGTEASTLIFAPTSATGTFVYTITRVSDGNGCSRNTSETATVVINSLPSAFITGSTLVCPDSENEYTGNNGVSLYQWSVTGNASIPGISDARTVSVTSGSLCGGSFNLVLTVTDGLGCSGTAEELVMIEDTDAPLITGTMENLQVDGCSVTDIPAAETTVSGLEAFGISISDNCAPDGNLIVTSSDGAPSGHCPSTVIRTYTLTDACGNSSHVAQTIILDDTTLPVIGCKITTTQTVIINASTVYVHTGNDWDYASASDNCGAVAVEATLSGATVSGPHSTLNGVTFNQGETTVTWSATDDCGNRNTCAFSVEVLGNADIAVTKTAPSAVTAGQNISWTITVTNNGPADAPEIVLTDLIPAGVSNATYTLDGVSMGNWTGTITLNDLEDGSDRTIVITAKTGCTAQGTLVNTASAELSPLDDPDTDNNTSTVTTQINAGAAIAASVTNTSCPGSQDGAINITVTGGTSPYNYSWVGPGGYSSTLEDISGLASGTYSVTVTDANLCATSSSIEVQDTPDNEPPVFTIPLLGSGYCVEGFEVAVYNPGGTYYVNDLIPVRRDYHIVAFGSTLLDVSNLNDNCPGTLTLGWEIDFGNDGSSDLSGDGQISASTPVNMPLGNNLITWILTDANGNESTQTTMFVVLPRPELID